MQWRNLTDMSTAVNAALPVLQSLNVNAVIGIPRSGMLPATQIACMLNVPLSDIHSARAHKFWWRNEQVVIDPKHILLVDDSVNGGNAMAFAMRGLRLQRLSRMAVYGRGNSAGNHVDHVLEVIEGPRIFEWNLFKHRFIMESLVDLDGVLCVDPCQEENDDGDKYVEFIRNARPLHHPYRTIGTICTSRLEKYRGLTIEWLERHGVKYERLEMLDLPRASARKPGMHAAFKSARYAAHQDAVLFIESDDRQARVIAKMRRPVISMEARTLYAR